LSDFVHLHVHTEYSLLDGAAAIPKLVSRAEEYGMKSLAITDHGNMFGIVKFQLTCKDHGIKPILGCEVYVAPRGRTDRVHEFDAKAFHLTLLAASQEGYLNLIKMVSEGYINGFYYKPRVDRELLAAHAHGLIALSGCLAGDVPSRLRNGDLDGAERSALWYRDTFGKDNFFLEIMDNTVDDTAKVNERLAQLSAATGIPLVASNDIHYVDAEDALIQEVLMCIDQGTTLTDTTRFAFDTSDYYLKSQERMREAFSRWPQACDATLDIAARCNFALTFGNNYLPKFELPDAKDPDDYLREITMQGLARKYPGDLLLPVHTKQAEYELGVIKKMGFSAYFLIVWDLLRFARSQDIPVGPGRGSVAGSIVAFALDITKIDPIKYDLLFERFLNPARVSMPDIDMDFCYERRNEVIEYCQHKYGADRVAQIITYGRLMAKNSIRDVGRVMGMPLPQVDRIAKMIPFMIPDKKVTIKNCLELVEDLKTAYEKDPEVKRLLDISMQIEGLARNVGVHAAGVVISEKQLTEHVPLYKAPRDDNEMYITMQEGGDLEKLGLLKMDFLGLRTLTVISDAVKFVQERTGREIDIDNIPLNDRPTYELLGKGLCDGVFQFEGNTAKNLMVRLQPTNLDDLIALNALNRPGPLGGGMVDDFLNNRNRQSAEIDYFHPDLEPVLRDTFGIILYQEQVMRIAQKIGGFSLADADNLRRAMGKKKKEEMDKAHGAFVEGALKDTTAEGEPKNVYTKQLAEKMFELMNYFSGYGFNKSHSAAYAFVAYQTAWLKANYPVEFMAALLTSVMQSTDKVSKYIQECRNIGIEVAPPDINMGFAKFRPVDNRILYGLAAVKNVGGNAIEAIIQERETGGPFKTIFDLCSRVDLKTVNSKTLEALVRCGACDSLPGSRAQKMAVLDEAMELGRRAQRDRASGQASLFGDDFDSTPAFEPSLPQVEEFSTETIIADEKDLLGLYLTVHPLDPYRDWIKQHATVNAVDLMDLTPAERRDVCVAGIIQHVRDFTTQRGDSMAILEVEDLTGTVVCSVGGEEYRRYKPELKEGNVVFVRGRIYIRTYQVKGEAREEARVVCKELDNRQGSANQAPAKKIHTMHFRMSADNAKAPKLVGELKNLLNANRGESRVILHVDNNGDSKDFLLRGNEVRISGELLRICRSFFGQDNVWVESRVAD
jgi:DNA polymerase-3 subunit alpha